MKYEPNGMMVADRLLREHGLIAPDEVWVHGMWTPGKWMRCVRARLGGKKLVRMTHGSLSPVCLARQGKWKKNLAKPIEMLLFALSDRMVCTGEWEVAWARRWGYRGPVQIIDLKRFFNLTPPVDAASAGKSLHVLYLGRRHPLKGIVFLERAIRELNDCSSPSPVSLRIVTDHTGGELARDWAWCDVLCLPTLSENFGLVVAEALARGKRVITTDGAPAWDPSVTGTDYGGRLVYLRGYRDGTDAARADGLKKALMTHLAALFDTERGERL